jgi:predicted aspartyl protease
MTTLSPNLEVPMGRVDTSLIISNRADQIEAERGLRDAKDTRSVTLDGVLVDTGATYLSVPADIVARLGLTILRELTIQTAAGPRRARLFRDATLSVMGREGTVDVLELPEGIQPLLGVIPLEVLGLEPDVARRRLRLLPDGPTETYVTAL